MIAADQLGALREVMEILKPWANVTKEMSAEKNVTVSKIIPVVFCIRRVMDRINMTTEMARNLRDNIVANLNERMRDIEKNMLYAIPTFLDPRFKSDNFESVFTCGNVVMALNEELKTLLLDTTKIQSDSVPSSAAEVDETYSIWNIHINMQTNKTPDSIPANSSGSTELGFYKNEAANFNLDPLTFWKISEYKYPSLCVLAQKYLAILATSETKRTPIF